MKVTDEMVTRFLGWKLPQDFLPDCGISFTPYMVGEPLRPLWPIGTNLLHAGQARAMLEHVLGEATDGDAAQRELAGAQAMAEGFQMEGKRLRRELAAWKQVVSDYRLVTQPYLRGCIQASDWIEAEVKRRLAANA